MGTQQLLLIVVGFIVVVLAVYAGYGMLSSYYQTANRDQLISTMQDLGVMAQQYFKKPAEQGGGGGTYLKWNLPKQFNKMDSGRIRATVTRNRINFVATGTEKGRNNRTVVRITCRVDNNGIRMTVTN